MQRVSIKAKNSLITPATYQPITLDEVKAQCRLGSSTAEDSLLEIYIGKARGLFEDLTGRQIMPAVWELWLDKFPTDVRIELPKSPLISVVSVKYIDGDGTEQTLSDTLYTVDTPSGENPDRGSVTLLTSTSTWPVTSEQSLAVTIQYEAGYVDTTVSPLAPKVPDVIKGFLLELVADSYQYRSVTNESAGTLVKVDPDNTIIRNFKTRSSKETWLWV